MSLWLAIAAPPRPTVSRVYRRLMERLPIRYADMRRIGGAVGPLRFSLALEALTPGRYDCQVTILDATAQKVAFWRAPIVVIP